MSTGWTIFLSALAAFLVLVLYVVWRIRRYLAKSQQAITDNLSEIVEEIDSYETKTQ